MYLKAQWNNAPVTPEVKEMAENGVTCFLLNHFNGVQNAFIAKQEFIRSSYQPRHHWNRAIQNAIDLATADVSPSSRQNMKWQIGFFDD